MSKARAKFCPSSWLVAICSALPSRIMPSAVIELIAALTFALEAGLLQTSLPTRPVPPARTAGLCGMAGRAAFVLDPRAAPPQGLGCGCHHHGMSRPAFTVGDGSRRRAVHLHAIRATSLNLRDRKSVV